MIKFKDETLTALANMAANVDIATECQDKVRQYAKNIMAENSIRKVRRGIEETRTEDQIMEHVKIGVGAEHALYRSGLATEVSQAVEDARNKMHISDRKRDCLIEGVPVEVKTCREFNNLEGDLNWMLTERPYRSVILAAKFCSVLLLMSWVHLEGDLYQYRCRYLLDLKRVAENPGLFRINSASFNDREPSYHFRFEPALERGVALDIQKFSTINKS